MKIKFGQANQNRPQPAGNPKATKPKKVEPTTSRGQRQFGRDITAQQNQPAYDFIVQDEVNIRIPSFLRNQPRDDPLTQQYEQQIMEYVVGRHDFYDLKNSQKLTESKHLKMRFTVLKPLYEVYLRLRLSRKTWETCVYYFDKFVEVTSLKLQTELMVAGNTCMLMAMKHEEIYPPMLGHWCPVKLYAMVPVELRVMEALQFKFNVSTPQHYLEYYMHRNHQSQEHSTLHEIVLDLYALTGECHNYHPLELVQMVADSFRSTSYLENHTAHQKHNDRVREEIGRSRKEWNFVINAHQKFSKYAKCH